MRPYIYNRMIDRVVEERRRMEEKSEHPEIEGGGWGDNYPDLENGVQSEKEKLSDIVRQLQATIRKATNGILEMDDDGDFICGCCGNKLTPEAAVAINERLAKEGLGPRAPTDKAEGDDLGDLRQPGEGAERG